MPKRTPDAIDAVREFTALLGKVDLTKVFPETDIEASIVQAQLDEAATNGTPLSIDTINRHLKLMEDPRYIAAVQATIRADYKP